MIAIGIVREFGRLIEIAESEILEGIEDGRIETEPSITDRFIDRIESILNQHRGFEGVVFRARTLRDRGANAPEAKFGADFCGVLNIKVEGFKQSKGFLSQAKMERNGIMVNRGRRGLIIVDFPQNTEIERLDGQIDNMLAITPDSFVIIYSNEGFVVVPAFAVRGLKTGAAVYGKPVGRFFKEYLMCFIGDHRLKAYDDQTLENLRTRTRSRTAILLHVLSSEYIDKGIIFS